MTESITEAFLHFVNCDQQFCINWDKEKGTCLLSAISLDSRGTCKNYVGITMEDWLLELKREESLAIHFRNQLKVLSTGGLSVE